MLTVTVDIGSAPPGAVKLQILFHWTRTTFEMPLLVTARESNPVSAEITTSLITIPLDGDAFSVLSVGENHQINVPYTGERPRLLGVAYIGPKDSVIVMADVIEKWLICRQLHSMGSPARAFFLDIDLQTNEALLPFGRCSDIAERKTQLDNAFFYLVLRMDSRRDDMRITKPKTVELAGLYTVDTIFRLAISRHFRDDVERVEQAFDQFSAGWLRHDAPPAYRGFLPIGACDPDSAAIFYFAEMAFAIVDCVEGAEPYWCQYLNCLVRMQRIFIERWRAKNVRCFELYDSTAPPLQGDLATIHAEYAKWGYTRGSLEKAMKANLELAEREC